MGRVADVVVERIGEIIPSYVSIEMTDEGHHVYCLDLFQMERYLRQLEAEPARNRFTENREHHS